jgi:hypothetical protein
MFITTVERFIGAGDEGFSPFDEGGREETRDHANNYLLQKRSVHSFFGAVGVPFALPKPPLLCAHDPQSQKQICYRVNQDA